MFNAVAHNTYEGRYIHESLLLPVAAALRCFYPHPLTRPIFRLTLSRPLQCSPIAIRDTSDVVIVRVVWEEARACQKQMYLALFLSSQPYQFKLPSMRTNGTTAVLSVAKTLVRLVPKNPAGLFDENCITSRDLPERLFHNA